MKFIQKTINFLNFSDVDDNESDDEDNNNEWEDDEENPLDMDILDAPTKSAKAKTVADVWFEQDIFKQALKDDNEDEEFELERKLNALQSDGIPVLGKYKFISKLTNKLVTCYFYDISNGVFRKNFKINYT